MQFYQITILIFGLSEQDGLILDQCASPEKILKIQGQKYFQRTIFVLEFFLAILRRFLAKKAIFRRLQRWRGRGGSWPPEGGVRGC